MEVLSIFSGMQKIHIGLSPLFVVLGFVLIILYYKNGRNSMGVKIVISKALLNLKLVYYKN
jgi:hypothetical protein